MMFCIQNWPKGSAQVLVKLTLSLPRVINFKFTLQPDQKYYIKHLAFHSLFRWKMIFLRIFTASLRVLGECTGWCNWERQNLGKYLESFPQDCIHYTSYNNLSWFMNACTNWLPAKSNPLLSHLSSVWCDSSGWELNGGTFFLIFRMVHQQRKRLSIFQVRLGPKKQKKWALNICFGESSLRVLHWNSTYWDAKSSWTTVLKYLKTPVQLYWSMSVWQCW